MIGSALDAPVPLAAAAFVGIVGGACYASSAQQMDKINSVLVALVVVTFTVSPRGRFQCRAKYRSKCFGLCALKP